MTSLSLNANSDHPTDAPGPPSSTTGPSNFVLYRASDAPPNLNAASLPDSFFEPTGADVKAAQTTLASRTQALTNAPLMTQSMREMNEKQRRDRWPQTSIRIRFHDRMQLEKSFSSQDGIKSVAAFLRSALHESMKEHKFILYQTPPRREFRVSDPEIRGKSLFDLRLSPSSVLYVKFVDEHINQLPTADLLASSVYDEAKDLPPPPEIEVPTIPTPSGNTLRSSAGSSTSGSAKVPKWLKLGKK